MRVIGAREGVGIRDWERGGDEVRISGRVGQVGFEVDIDRTVLCRLDSSIG